MRKSAAKVSCGSCTEDLDNCEYDFSDCSNVQSGESCEIKCNPPYVLAAPRIHVDHGSTNLYQLILADPPISTQKKTMELV